MTAPRHGHPADEAIRRAEAGPDREAPPTTGGTDPAEDREQHEEHDAEGRTPAAWTATGGIIAASLVGAVAVILNSLLVGVLAVALGLAFLAVAGIIGRAAQARADAGTAAREQPQPEPGAAGHADSAREAAAGARAGADDTRRT